MTMGITLMSQGSHSKQVNTFGMTGMSEEAKTPNLEVRDSRKTSSKGGTSKGSNMPQEFN